MDKYVIFYKKKDSTSTVFDFEAAKADFIASTNFNYLYQDGLLTTTSVIGYDSNVNKPGNTIQVGVLTYLEDSITNDKYFSESNTNILECSVQCTQILYDK